ncbi:hypothetical protein TNCT_170251 [Trichonephila clavata]|uniref:Uncharacterized protein n=1 Tax=Trichonephila clavata TaxID=2740835 RepID=A0A8X6HFY2_TRICU|nr:hypothetical protein TNCT_170251 [Trichonephila clavata]
MQIAGSSQVKRPGIRSRGSKESYLQAFSSPPAARPPKPAGSNSSLKSRMFLFIETFYKNTSMRTKVHTNNRKFKMPKEISSFTKEPTDKQDFHARYDDIEVCRNGQEFGNET